MLQKTKLKIERFLYKKGFTDEALRAIILAQLALLIISATVAVLALPFSYWPACFFVGVFVFEFNFWNMSLYLLAKLPGGYSTAFLKGQLFRFFGRILLTAFILAGALILGGSPVALGLGVFSCLVVISIIALVRFSGRN